MSSTVKEQEDIVSAEKSMNDESKDIVSIKDCNEETTSPPQEEATEEDSANNSRPQLTLAHIGRSFSSPAVISPSDSAPAEDDIIDDLEDERKLAQMASVPRRRSILKDSVSSRGYEERRSRTTANSPEQMPRRSVSFTNKAPESFAAPVPEPLTAEELAEEQEQLRKERESSRSKQRRGSFTENKIDMDTNPVTLHAKAAEWREEMMKGTLVMVYFAKPKKSSRLRRGPMEKKMYYSCVFGGLIYIFKPENERFDRTGQESKPLMSLQSVYMGAQTTEFQSDHFDYKNRPVNFNACFTMVGSFGSVAVECASVSIADAWVRGLSAIARARGKAIIVHHTYEFLKNKGGNLSSYDEYDNDVDANVLSVSSVDDEDSVNLSVTTTTPVKRKPLSMRDPHLAVAADSPGSMGEHKSNTVIFNINLSFKLSNVFQVSGRFGSKRNPLIQVFLKARYEDRFHFLGQTEPAKGGATNVSFKTSIPVQVRSREQMVMCVLAFDSTEKHIQSGKYRYGYVAIRLLDLAVWPGTQFTFRLDHKSDTALREKLKSHKTTLLVTSHRTAETHGDGVLQRIDSTDENLFKRRQSLNNLFQDAKTNQSRLVSTTPTTSSSKPRKLWSKLRSVLKSSKESSKPPRPPR